MFKKLNTKTLLALFGVLLVLVVILQLVKNHSGEGNFRSKIIETDTADITKITILPKKANDKVVLTKTGNSWDVVSQGKTYKADQNMIKNILGEIAKLQAERIAANDKSEWEKYQVSDTAALHVSIDSKGKSAENVIIGKFSYQQNPQKFTTYVRLVGEKEVYAVNGFLSMTFNRSANDFRDKTLVNVRPESITDITFTYPADSSFTLKQSGSKWMINNQPADSAKVAEFKNSISHLTGYYIADDDDKMGPEVFSVKLGLNNLPPVEVKALASDSIVKYILTSNSSDVHIEGPKSGLMQRVFPGPSHFMKMKK